MAWFKPPPAALRRLAGRAPRWVRAGWRRARGGSAGPWPRPVALCALLDDQAQNAARRLQLELESRHGANPSLQVPPHVTLKLGFEAPGPGPLEQYLDQLAASTEPFELGLGPLGFFDEGIVFLDVEPHPQIAALRWRILGELAARFGVEPYPLEAGDGFHFHVTLAAGLRPRALAEVRRSPPAPPPPIRFRLDRLALLYAVGEGWATGRIASLGRTRHRP